ncbi:hypothetical protein LX36DRAFT_650853 [Colletotrichum falcatum]|nr:hypothetical protein LX36DRAFT_650853 [Colletotrichum falcatum]
MAETTDGTQTRPDDDMTMEGGVQPTGDAAGKSLRRSPLSDADERPPKRAKTGASEIATAMSLAQSHFDSDFGNRYKRVDTFPLLHSRSRQPETREDLIAYGQKPPELDSTREIEPMRRTRRVRRKIVYDDPSPQTPTALDSVLGEVKVQIENVGTNVTKILRDMSDIREGIQAEEIKGAEILHVIEDLRKASTTSTVGKEIDARLTALEEGQKEIKLLLHTLQEAVHPSDPVAVSRTRGRTGSDDSQDVNPVDDAPPGEETE